MASPMTEYFVFDVNGRQTGLVRRTRNDEAQTLTLEYVSDGQWFDDPDLIRYFEGFGGDQTDVVALTEDEARAQATSLGVLTHIRGGRDDG